MAGNIPIGWGNSDDSLSKKTLTKAFEKGITFFDTADLYGFGHSETLIGEVIGNNKEIIIATKEDLKEIRLIIISFIQQKLNI